VDGYSDAVWASCVDDRRTSGCCVFVDGNLYHGEVRSNQWCQGRQPKLSMDLCHMDLVRCCG
jgi:hypothetical protein